MRSVGAFQKSASASCVCHPGHSAFIAVRTPVGKCASPFDLALIRNHLLPFFLQYVFSVGASAYGSVSASVTTQGGVVFARGFLPASCSG